MSKAPSHTPRFSMADFSLKKLLGGLSPDRFLAEYWQKKPLLIRQALPGFGSWLTPDSLRQLAGYEDAESRLVQFKGGRWHLRHGPFEPPALDALPAKNWSLLVSGVNHFLTEGDELLNAFDFVPRARLDDLMVSLAPAGGGVGPHFDSYDVFLIQGLGRRRWEISDQPDLRLMEGIPLRILENFQATQSWELEPGDMLYLPPKYAHNGVALDTCMTWSVGFRAPKREEVVSQFFAYMQDQAHVPGMYTDPDLKRPRHAGELPEAMLQWTTKAIRECAWDDKTIEDFLGRYLSEPKAHVFFDPPDKPLSRKAFTGRVNKRGLRLDPRSQLLFRSSRYYLNGESVCVPKTTPGLGRQLANHRSLPADTYPDAWLDIFYDWYCSGYVIV
jgi:50S ribosomal protein L16 3-hydroxylase